MYGICCFIDLTGELLRFLQRIQGYGVPGQNKTLHYLKGCVESVTESGKARNTDKHGSSSRQFVSTAGCGKPRLYGQWTQAGPA
jgi:hypothetical protein